MVVSAPRAWKNMNVFLNLPSLRHHWLSMNLLLISRNVSEMSLLAGPISSSRIEMFVQSKLPTRRFVSTDLSSLMQFLLACASVNTLFLCGACLLIDVVHDYFKKIRFSMWMRNMMLDSHFLTFPVILFYLSSNIIQHSLLFAFSWRDSKKDQICSREIGQKRGVTGSQQSNTEDCI